LPPTDGSAALDETDLGVELDDIELDVMVAGGAEDGFEVTVGIDVPVNGGRAGLADGLPHAARKASTAAAAKARRGMVVTHRRLVLVAATLT
jgi:hypothetical protein